MLPEAPKPRKKPIIEAPVPTTLGGPASIVKVLVQNYRGLLGELSIEVGQTNLVIIEGSPRAGKSTILDAIGSTMDAAGYAVPNPIHDGVDEAKTALLLSNGILTQRRWVRDDKGQAKLADITLWETVADPDSKTGFKYVMVGSKPQSVLNKFLDFFHIYILEGSEKFDTVPGQREFRDEVMSLVTLPDPVAAAKDLMEKSATEDGLSEADDADRLMFVTIGEENLNRWSTVMKGGKIQDMDIDPKTGQEKPKTFSNVYELIARDKLDVERVRREVGRDAERTRHAAEEMVVPFEYAKAEKVDTAALSLELKGLTEQKAENARKRKALLETQGNIQTLQSQLKQVDADLQELENKYVALVAGENDNYQHELARLAKEHEDRLTKLGVDQENEGDRLRKRTIALNEEGYPLVAQLQGQQAEVDGLVDPDTTALETQIREADKINRAVQIREAKAAMELQAKTHEDNYAAYDAQVNAVDRFNQWLAKNSKWPVPGIGFSDDFLTWQGRPWFDLSGSERIVAIACVRIYRNEQKPEAERFRDVLLDEFAGGEDTVKALVGMFRDYRFWIVARTFPVGQGLKITNADGNLLAPVGPVPEPLSLGEKP